MTPAGGALVTPAGGALVTRPVLAVDAGKTACRAAVFGPGPDGRGPTGTGPGFANVAAPGALEQIRGALRTALAGLPVEEVGAVCIGLTGVLPPSPRTGVVAEVVRDVVGDVRIIVTSDVVSAYAGALGLRPGVVVAAGTGAITLAAGPDGAVARVDGWGYLLDDAGSAFAIGRAGLRAVLRALDGRGAPTALRAAAVAAHGSEAAIVDAVYGAGNAASTVAAFAVAVSRAAGAGDDVAARILRAAGTDLAHAAASGARRVLDTGGAVAVSWQGGVFLAGEAVLGPFRAALADALPSAVLQPPAGDALDGAAALARADTPTVLDALMQPVAAVAR